MQLMVPHDERETAAEMLHDIVGRIAAAAGTDVEDSRQHIVPLAHHTGYGMSDELKLAFADAVLEAQIYVERGNFNADITVTGDERCVDAAAAVSSLDDAPRQP